MPNIFATNPYGQPIKNTSIFDTANATLDLLNKGYRNQQSAAQTQYAQDTLRDAIAAANAKSQADAQFYPQQQMFKTQQDEATVREIQARTGLTYAQAKEAAAQAGLISTQQQVLANPFTPTGNMIKQWQNLPVDSPEKMALGSILDSSGLGGGMFPTGATMPGAKGSQATKSNAAMMTGPLPGLGGAGWVRDPRFGSTRGGGGGTYINPATGQVVSTDTATQASRDQRAIAGTENVKQYVNTITNTLPKYQTLGSQASLWKDKLSNYVLGTHKQAPTDQALGDAAIKASAEGFLNTFQLNATEGNVNTAMEILKPRFGESGDNYKARVISQLTDFAKQEQRAQDRLAGGNLVGQTTPSPMSLGYFRANSVSDPSVWGLQQQSQSAVQQPTQQTQQPVNAAQLQAMAQDAIAKGADPIAVQARLKQMLGGAGG